MDKLDIPKIAGRIVYARGSESQVEFSARIGIAQEKLSGIENAKYKSESIYIDIAERIADKTHFTKDFILFGENRTPNEHITLPDMLELFQLLGNDRTNFDRLMNVARAMFSDPKSSKPAK